nr:ATP-binding protein [Luteimonas sp. XNQY3]
MHIDVAPGVPWVRGDIAIVERVTTNLVDNAIRHTRRDGSVTPSVRQGVHCVVVTVADEGPGVDPALRETLFRQPAPFGPGRRQGRLGIADRAAHPATAWQPGVAPGFRTGRGVLLRAADCSGLLTSTDAPPGAAPVGPARMSVASIRDVCGTTPVVM